jgi:hypothetical protein
MRLLPRIATGLLVASCVTLAGQDEDEPPPYARAREHMTTLVCRLPPRDGQPERVLDLIEKPALSYTDPARKNSDGSVWVWPAKGRPRAIVELFRSNLDVQWLHAIALTSDELVELDIPNGQQWRPKSSGLTWTTLPDPVSESAPARLRQMKVLARRFSTHEFWDPDNSRYELRLLVSPLHRYADEDVLDGALFGFVHGTNPEIVLILETLKSDAKRGWRYAFTRLGSAEMHAELDGKDVWTVPRAVGVVGAPIDPYWMFWTDDRRPER